MYEKSAFQRIATALTPVVGLVLISILAYAIYSGMIALRLGKTALASDYAAFASAIATVILTFLTGFYTYSTRKLVEQSKRERELREQERVEDWYEDIISTTRLLIDRWEQEFAEPNGMTKDGNPYISLQKRKAFWQDFDNLAEQLREQVSRHPADASAEVVRTARDFYRELFLLQTPDSEQKYVEYEGTLRTQLDELLKSIKIHQNNLDIPLSNSSI